MREFSDSNGLQKGGEHMCLELVWVQFAVLCYGHSFYVQVGLHVNFHKVNHSGNASTILAVRYSNIIFHVLIFFHWACWYGVNALGMCSGDAWFESWFGQWLSWVRFLSLRQILGEYLDLAVTASFQVPSYSLFVNHHTIWHLKTFQ